MAPEVTPELDDFLRAMEADDNEWWRIGCGHHLNLFDMAVERMEAAEARLADAVVINRDDIPEGLAAAVANVGQVIADLTDESWGPLDIDWLEDAEEKFEALARLLSGGSPAAPEDGGT